jgi:hypothetical protein
MNSTQCKRKDIPDEVSLSQVIAGSFVPAGWLSVELEAGEEDNAEGIEFASL